MTHSDDESIIKSDQGEECRSIREYELNTRNLLRDKDSDGSNQLSSLNGIACLISHPPISTDRETHAKDRSIWIGCLMTLPLPPWTCSR